MKKILFVLSVCFSFTAFCQLEMDPDTVLYEQKTGGEIDTFDIANGDLPTTFENGRSVLSETGLSTSSLLQDFLNRKMQRPTSFAPLKFSAIPHLGFAYSFGGQGSQFVRLDYSQAFTENLLFNLKYDRNIGNGYLQNSNFKEDHVRMQLQKKGQRYSLQLKSSFQSFNVTHSGGIVGDSASLSSIELFGLGFTSVNKSDASSATKQGRINLKNYVNFTSDSLIHLGLVTHHDYSITHREYIEDDFDLNSIYDTTFIDTTHTRDQFNHARIRNAGGVYFSNRKNSFYLDGVIEYGYWNFQNLGTNFDTTEIGLVSNARFNWNDLVLTNKARINFIGAFNEWSEEAKLKLERDRLKLRASFVLKSEAPDPFIRKYIANNFQYQLNSFAKSTIMRTGAILDWRVKDSMLNVSLGGDFTTLSNIYMFDGTQWSTSTSSMAFSSIKAKANLSLGIFNLNPSVVYSIDNTGFIPDVQLYARAFIKGRLFKAKRLEALVGVDASYISSFNTRVYSPALDLMDLSQSGSGTNGISNLHAFISFGIEEFRFFVRYENIGYFWNSSLNEEMSNYPIAGTRMRVGLTWDFFN